MTIVLIPAPRLAVDSGPTAIPNHVPPAWLDDPTRPISFRTLAAAGLPEPAPVVTELPAMAPQRAEFSSASNRHDPIRIRLIPKANAEDPHRGDLALGVFAAAGLTAAACACLVFAHMPTPASTPPPVPAMSAPPSHQPSAVSSHRPPCDIDPTSCGARIVPVAAVQPMTLAEALGMAVAVAP